MTDLRITPEQADLLRERLAAYEAAKEGLGLVFSAIVRGHGLTEATFERLDGAWLIVRTPDGADDGVTTPGSQGAIYITFTGLP